MLGVWPAGLAGEIGATAAVLAPTMKLNFSSGKYVGESARNLFARGMEHLNKYRNGNTKSFMKSHQDECHPGQEADFKAKVTGSSKDCLTRQVREAVQIRRSSVPVRNSKTERHQPVLWKIRNEILRG